MIFLLGLFTGLVISLITFSLCVFLEYRKNRKRELEIVRFTDQLIRISDRAINDTFKRHMREMN